MEILPENQLQSKDDEHLRLLAMFHYAYGGVTMVFALFPAIHVTIGLLFIFSPELFQKAQGDMPPAFFGWVFLIAGASLMILGLTTAGLILYAGRCIRQRKHHLFILVVAGIECVMFPLGTVLGVFTFIVLLRDSVKPLFESIASEQDSMYRFAE